eukprot:CAMPEP_0197034274 /NCGR_PEP_ID=MMETSP1384-20130603/12438_1 /TAXON_ID=29189 /ORGANISM="Ammonia sp." /LENGTH=347 /DNA_ID=CAMNT_0042464181 /DNA_START=376 /DNA_END=1419 /DNA_ORIENTATION=+
MEESRGAYDERKERLIDVPGYHADEEDEVFEKNSSHTGTAYGDDVVEMSVSTRDVADGVASYQPERHDSVQTVSYQALEKSTKKVVSRAMLGYCALFVVVLLAWFAIATVSPHFDSPLLAARPLLYIALLFVYYVGKCYLKRMGREIDRATIIANFSFEVITEILMSTFYWCNFRMFSIRFNKLGKLPVLSLAIVAVLHIFCEVFQNSIRMSAPYFNWVGRWRTKNIKSNILQWKVRGAIDAGIRFVIAIYSFCFTTFRVLAQCDFKDFEKDIKQHFSFFMCFNTAVFAVEMVYFGLILLKPGCAGTISDQQQINMAEPLMRVYSANKPFFLLVFCGSMIIASWLIL